MDLARLPESWPERHRAKLSTPQAALAALEPGQRIFVGSGAAAPRTLLAALARRADDLYDTEIVHILTLGMDPTAHRSLSDRFRHSAFFLGPETREAVAEAAADYTPIFLSEVPELFLSGSLPIDVALVSLSPPDRHGFASFGVSVDIVKAATAAARRVVAEINPAMPRTLGDSFVHLDDVDAIVLAEWPLPELAASEADAVARRIGRYAASLIEDGATLQIGLGEVPNAVLAFLGDRRDLGIHTEMLADGILPLVASGVLNGSRKTLHEGKIVASFALGSRALYALLDNNPLFELHPSEYVNDPVVIARNDRMVALNSALEVDLTGQVCADSLGHRFYSGIGGQVDFLRGAARSRGGRPVIVLPSTAEGGARSRIVRELPPGAGVTVTRGDVHYVVSEFGIAQLHGRSIRQRALSLINIAHPRFRRGLLDGAKELGYVEREQIAITDREAAYPLELERRVTLAGGAELLVRPIKASDEDLIRELFYSHTDETRYYRFFAAWKFLPKKTLQYLVNIDYEEMMALAAVDLASARGRILGVARYYLDRHTGLAEFAIAVHDDWQRRGVGTALLRRLIEIARERGVRGFTAEVLFDNVKMFRFLESLGYPLHSRVESGVSHLELHFGEVEDTRTPSAEPAP